MCEYLLDIIKEGHAHEPPYILLISNENSQKYTLSVCEKNSQQLNLIQCVSAELTLKN